MSVMFFVILLNFFMWVFKSFVEVTLRDNIPKVYIDKKIRNRPGQESLLIS